MFTKKVKLIHDGESINDGIKKWHSEALNAFASHIRKYGLEKKFRVCRTWK